MKKSPGCRVRVSVTMLPISPPRSPALTSPPTASATHPSVSLRSRSWDCPPVSPNSRPETPRVQRLPRHRHIVERQRRAAHLLILLVPLTRDQHDVAGLRVRHRIRDRVAPIDDGDDLDASLARFRDRKSTRLNSSHLVISYAVF